MQAALPDGGCPERLAPPGYGRPLPPAARPGRLGSAADRDGGHFIGRGSLPIGSVKSSVGADFPPGPAALVQGCGAAPLRPARGGCDAETRFPFLFRAI